MQKNNIHLGVIGFPLSHSLSPQIFEKIFENENVLQGSYKLYPIEDVSVLPNWLKTVQGLAGFNVTIPHKKTIIPLLHGISEEAAAIGSVNTVKVKWQGTTPHLFGCNTDFFGFSNTLKQFLGNSKPQKALILGTGGTSNTVAYTLKNMGIEYIKVSRKSSAEAPLTYDDISERTLANYHLIINTTPLGMYPATKSFPQLPYDALTDSHYLYDLVYNPLHTMFLQKGAKVGAHTQTGLAMLELQAQKAWEIWTEDL